MTVTRPRRRRCRSNGPPRAGTASWPFVTNATRETGRRQCDVGNSAIASWATMQQASEQLTPPARQRRPADYDLASAKANGFNVGQGRRRQTTHGTPRRRGCWGPGSPCSLWIRRGHVGPGRQGIGVLALFRPQGGKVADRAHAALRVGARKQPFAARLAQATMAARHTGDEEIQ